MRILTIALVLASTTAALAQPAKPAFDAKAARRILAREAIAATKRDCHTLIETRRGEENDITIADCLSNDGATILRYRIRAGATLSQPASVELMPTPS